MSDITKRMIEAAEWGAAEIHRLCRRVKELEEEVELHLKALTGAALLFDEEKARAEAAEAKLARVLPALEFYADPTTYHAILVVPDRPCGEFADDFSEDHGEDFYDRPMPGKRARAALAREK